MDYPEQNIRDISPQKDVETHPNLTGVDTTTELVKAIEGSSKEEIEVHEDAVTDNLVEDGEHKESETEAKNTWPLHIPSDDGEPKVEWFKTEQEWTMKYADLRS